MIIPFKKGTYFFSNLGGDPHEIGINWYYPRYEISKDSASKTSYTIAHDTKKQTEKAKNNMIFDKVAEYAFIDSGQALIISRFGKIVH